ncbi:MAG: hypothetical protein H7333_04490 [Bdellovibrionales bacterium]|nr:hypothetical protein [Oligoflexia bacterium]
MQSKGRALIFYSLLLVGCSPRYNNVAPVVPPKDAPQSALGERLFRDFRFSKFFVEHSAGDSNQVLAGGDPRLDSVTSGRRGTLANPFAGQAMSCVACHMVGDAEKFNKQGMRAYTDFASRSSIPALGTDSLVSTPRNTPTLLGALSPRNNFLLHYDGEFTTIEDLILGSYTGRNFGWLPGEEAIAKANFIKVIREDNGQSLLAQSFGRVSYKALFQGTDPSIPNNFKIPEEYRLDLATATDQQVIDRAVNLVKVYLEALQFAQDAEGHFVGSPWDQFLIANRLPNHPDDGELDVDYAARLSLGLQGLSKPKYIEDFDEKEFTGAKIFLARSTTTSAQGAGFFQVGNCVACHAPPSFTDFKFHNTGATQDEYDAIHGAGAFELMSIPNYLTRTASPNLYLPATGGHPTANSRFRAPPSVEHPERTDLGAWNIFTNPDFPVPQAILSQLFCTDGACATPTDTEEALTRSLAAFKTPGLRLLGMSDPYLHGGTQTTIPDLMRFYQRMSVLARAGRLRNPDPEIEKIKIDKSGADALTAFLNSLNEEYD